MLFTLPIRSIFYLIALAYNGYILPSDNLSIPLTCDLPGEIVPYNPELDQKFVYDGFLNRYEQLFGYKPKSNESAQHAINGLLQNPEFEQRNTMRSIPYWRPYIGFLMYKLGDNPLGFIIFTLNWPTDRDQINCTIKGDVEHIFVALEYRKKGIGTHLLSSAIKAMQENAKIILTSGRVLQIRARCITGNEQGERLFTKNKFFLDESCCESVVYGKLFSAFRIFLAQKDLE